MTIECPARLPVTFNCSGPFLRLSSVSASLNPPSSIGLPGVLTPNPTRLGDSRCADDPITPRIGSRINPCCISTAAA